MLSIVLTVSTKEIAKLLQSVIMADKKNLASFAAVDPADDTFRAFSLVIDETLDRFEQPGDVLDGLEVIQSFHLCRATCSASVFFTASRSSLLRWTRSRLREVQPNRSEGQHG